MRTQFPNVIAAVEARQKILSRVEGGSLWDLGKALIVDIKPALDVQSRNGVNDGSFAKIEACAKELEERGFLNLNGEPYKTSTLSDFMNVALTFPANRRHQGLSFNHHREAFNPDMLDWVVKALKKDKRKPTIVAIRELVSLRQRHLEEERRDDEGKRTGKKLPPRREMPAPTEEETPVLLKELSLMCFADEAELLADRATKLGLEAAKELSRADVEIGERFLAGAIHAAMETVNSLEAAIKAWRQVADAARKQPNNRRSHLAAVS